MSLQEPTVKTDSRCSFFLPFFFKSTLLAITFLTLFALPGQLAAQAVFSGTHELGFELTPTPSLTFELDPTWEAIFPYGNFEAGFTGDGEAIYASFADESLDEEVHTGIVGTVIVSMGGGSVYHYVFQHCGGGILVVVLNN